VKPNDPCFWPLPLSFDEHGRPFRYRVEADGRKFGFSNRLVWSEFVARLKANDIPHEATDTGRQWTYKRS
jgi:hypothetical protein